MFQDVEFKGIFKSHYELHGKDWVRSLPEEDRKIFVHIGAIYHEYGRLGGRARAEKGKRDERGRFARAK